MNKNFEKEIAKTLKIYTNDMIIKSSEEEWHYGHVNNVFRRGWQYNMMLNPEKCTLEVRADKFLSLCLTGRGKKSNSYKCETIIKMETLTTKKGIMK